MEENQSLIRKMESDARDREKRLEDLLVALVNKANLPQLAEQLTITDGSTHQPPLHTASGVKSFHHEGSPAKNPFMQHGGEAKDELGMENDDNSFLSINDFINADDYENEINLEESR